MLSPVPTRSPTCALRDAGDAFDRRGRLCRSSDSAAPPPHSPCSACDLGQVGLVQLRLVRVFLLGNRPLLEESCCDPPPPATRPGWPLPWSSWLFASASAASNGRGSISKSTIAFFDQRAFLIIALDQVAGYTRSDFRVLRSIERADPFPINRHVARRRFRHENLAALPPRPFLPFRNRSARRSRRGQRTRVKKWGD